MTKTVLERAREVFDTEIEGLQAVRANLIGPLAKLGDRSVKRLGNAG